MRSLLVAFAVLLVGCNARDAGNLTDDAGSLVKHTTQAAGSVQLAGRVWATLSNTKGIDLKGIHVDAQDGVVTVSGHVRNQKEKDRVLAVTDSIRGVDKVVDKLRVAG